MPSKKDPNAVVQPGPGKLAANEVPASAITFPIGGGGDLAAHIGNPLDAHMAGAIGLPDVYPPTGLPLRSTVGGPYDGESLLDAVAELANLLPVKPNRIGFNASVPNSGFTNWSTPLTVGGATLHAGWTKGGAGIVSKYVTSTAPGTVNPTGIVYPADRGVLALYKSISGNFFDSANTALVSALWLGSNPAPAGVPTANFNQGTRPVSQTAYTPANSGIDFFGLTNRYPYLSDYSSHGGVYANYTQTFYTYQLATYTVPVALVSGDAGSFLLVHWHEQYATTLASIQPAALTGGTLIQNNCYSAVPADGAALYAAVNRLNVYLDALAGTAVTIASVTSAAAGTTTSAKLSGVAYYTSTGLQFNVVAVANNVFKNSYLTNDTASASVLAGFESTTTSVRSDTTAFGGIIQPWELYDAVGSHVVNNAGGAAFSLVSPPATTAVVKFQHTTLPIGGGANNVPYPFGQLSVRFGNPFSAPVAATDTTKYLFNSLGTTGSSDTIENFTDEQYRYLISVTPIAALPILPAGGNIYPSSSAIIGGDSNLQELSGKLVYPQTDFTAGYSPSAGQPNYATVFAGDAGSTKRRYLRAFNTGIARNTGHLTLNGLAFSAFDAGLAAIDPAEVADHPGGAIVQIQVPGSTGWLDLGRALGQPALSTADFNGCRTGIAGATFAFTSTAFTSDNGSGKFLLFVRITFIHGPGDAMALDSLIWTP